MHVYTIGFTQKKAEHFFTLIRNSNIRTLIDVRLNNISQLSGFAKKDDLRFFLRELCDASYIHLPDWAPTKDILSAYQKKAITWDAYQDKFLNLMARRSIEKDVDQSVLEQGCLLCSEHQPHHCHRRLVVEYLNEHTGLELQVKHLI
ncbi:DUF488 family protein [Sedimenticola thiotaurini]|uniref:DUF488 domain-containing protein n=1 Tax=Sedimenticola thiotaurini TaxID=1543721 RepID=A0A0F7JTU0_9GAMM|nr:DUF488 domain-containing protein [Sedimenticola thiotaurini]AKH19961.1 hypothetical protein AAY24_05915 [Sedimenticola thiotaurini]